MSVLLTNINFTVNETGCNNIHFYPFLYLYLLGLLWKTFQSLDLPVFAVGWIASYIGGEGFFSFPLKKLRCVPHRVYASSPGEQHECENVWWMRTDHRIEAGSVCPAAQVVLPRGRIEALWHLCPAKNPARNVGIVEQGLF